jgi:hypothetical protein
MRRTHLRFHDNIIKRLLIHAGAFNLSLIMRKLAGRGTPRGFQGCISALVLSLQAALLAIRRTEALQYFRSQFCSVTSREIVTSLRLPDLCSHSGFPLSENYSTSGC